MPNQYPSLKPKEICDCLIKLGFEFKKSRNRGDHKYYVKGNRVVQVDMGEKAGFATPGMKIIISNSEYDRETFYRATKKTAKKIGGVPLTDEELNNLPR